MLPQILPAPGMLRSLLDQDEMYNQMLHEFLEQGDGHPRISWIHNIRMGQYQSASQQLIQEAETELYLQEKAVGYALWVRTDLRDERFIRYGVTIFLCDAV